MRVLAILTAILAASPAVASLQTDYAAAQAALDAEHWQEARDRFAGLLGHLPATQKHTAALLAARLGVAEARLGNGNAAIARLTTALPLLDRPEDGDERILARFELGAAYEDAAELANAARAYTLAMAEPRFAGDRLGPNIRIGLVRALVFADPARARAEYDALVPIVGPLLKAKPEQLATFYDLRGRIELNDQKFDAARIWFLKALPLAGGLTEKVTILSQRVRSDIAIAAFLGGHADEARRYLAYTGAAYRPMESLTFNDAMPPPACAPLTELRPDDVAVVEIRVADDGSVSGATTVYASRTGGPETAFAAAARDWRWDQAALKKLPPFWRQALRFEIRCNTSRDDPGLGFDLFNREIEAWYATARIEPLPMLPDDAIQARAALAAEVRRRIAAYGPDSPQLFPTMFNLRAGLAADDRAATDRLLAFAEAGNAPRDVVTALRGGAAYPADRKMSDMRVAATVAPALERIIADTTVRGGGESRGVAFLRVRLGVERERLKDDDGAAAAYRAALAAPSSTVPSADPIRQVALLRLSSIEAAHKRLAEASALYRQTGLSAEQCSLVDVKPLPTRQSVGEDDFPREALAWHFEGLVRVGYDIDTSGKPLGVRTIMAFPPFAFSKGTERAAATFRFRPIFREGSDIGCSGHSSTIRYQIRG